jgi:hypothetical protein
MANPIESTPKIRKQNTKKINKIGLGGGSKLGHTSKNKV